MSSPPRVDLSRPSDRPSSSVPASASHHHSTQKPKSSPLQKSFVCFFHSFLCFSEPPRFPHELKKALFFAVKISMSFHHHQTPHEMAFHSSFASPDQQPPQLAPTWLNAAPFRQQQSSFSRNDDVVISPSGKSGDRGGEEDDEDELDCESGRFKADIVGHPLYEQLVSAHVSCLRIATPVDQLPKIDEQLVQSQRVVDKYSAMRANGDFQVMDEKELDLFMTNYVLLLCSFKEQLQQHVRVHAMEAVMACWELEQSLQSLTGVSTAEGTGATMSDDDDQFDSDINSYDASLDGHDTMGFGPLVPTESERSLMERVRQELKHELKQGYKEKIVDIREEILRKRRAGKLPGDTTSVLKAWWQTHSKWPYPTEEDKARLVQETGLQLKQINNWFINQRKRNWHSNLSTTSVLKSKRKSNAGDGNTQRFK